MHLRVKDINCTHNKEDGTIVTITCYPQVDKGDTAFSAVGLGMEARKRY
jgi:hypothetical protein